MEWLIRTIQLYLAAPHERPSRMAGRGPRCGYYMLHPLEDVVAPLPMACGAHNLDTGRQHRLWSGVGIGTPPAERRALLHRRRAGAGGADTLVNHQTWTQIHVTHYVGAGGGPVPTAEDWDLLGRTGGRPGGRRTSKGPQEE